MSIALRPRLHAGLWLFCLCAPGAAIAAPPCAAGDTPAIELRVVAAAIAPDADRTTVVRVFDDGCVHVHRPAYRRDAGEFRVDLEPAALGALRRQVDQSALRTFDAKRIRADLAATQGKRATPEGAAQRYIELDADQYELAWRSDGKRAAAAWPGLPAYAEAYPDNVPLQAFHNAAAALQALADRGDAAAIDGGRP
ncbi:MAG TPA: hypothetical protein VM555_06855 [Tahibacter sp.]|nr:hypothetical protein [Tahibacter sp.]